MAASSNSVLRARAKGMAQRRFSIALFFGVAALPLLTMGITVPTAISKSNAVNERQQMLDRLERREGMVRSLEGYKDDRTLLEMEALHTQLLAMIPTQVEALSEFGVLRSTAESLGITLMSVRAVRTHRLGGGPSSTDVDGSALPGSGAMGDGAAPSDSRANDSGTVVLDEVLVTVREPVDAILTLVDSLRERGLPTVLLGLDMSRERPGQSAFQAELRLGFVRRALP